MASNIDTLRKILVTGVGTALMTEDSLVKLLSELKLPRDVKNYIVMQAQKRKDEITKIVSNEIKRFLSRVSIHEELRKALTGLKIDVDATIYIDRQGSTVKLTKSRIRTGRKT